MPLTVPLHPVLQVGVNPPGIKTSFSLPLRQDHSTALVIPHCRDSRALEVHTHSVLSSRITCLPTVSILALMGKKKKKKYIELCLKAMLVLLPILLEVWGMDDWSMWYIRGQSFHWVLHLCIMTKLPTGIQPLSWIATCCCVKDCQSQSTVPWPELKGKKIIPLLKILAIWVNSLPGENADHWINVREQSIGENG